MVLILHLLGSIALFLFGMNMLNKSMQDMFGNKVNSLVSTLTATPIRSLLTGLLVTICIQSSTAASLITISLTDAAVLTFQQAFNILIGCNIGTTLKLWIFNFGNLHSTGVEYFIFGFLILGIFLYFRTNYKNIGNTLLGISLMLIALNFLHDYIPTDWLHKILDDYKDFSIINSLIFLLIGVALAALVHSSSAVLFTFIVAFSISYFNVALLSMLIIGVNIGTTLSALIASIVTGNIARRVAFSHFIFNVSGAILFIPFILPISTYIYSFSFSENYYIPIFHTLFNVVTGVFVFLFQTIYISQIKKIFVQKSTYSSLVFSESFLSINPSIHLIKAHNEINTFASIVVKSINKLGSLLSETDAEKFQNSVDLIVNLENQSDDLEKSIREYLKEINKIELTATNSHQFQQASTLIHNLENISDLALGVAIAQKERKENQIYFKPFVRDHLLEMQELVWHATQIMVQHVHEFELTENQFNEAKNIENNINIYYKKTLETLKIYIAENQINASAAIYFKDILTKYENIGDFLFKISKEIKST